MECSNPVRRQAALIDPGLDRRVGVSSFVSMGQMKSSVGRDASVRISKIEVLQIYCRLLRVDEGEEMNGHTAGKQTSRRT